jgi:hypothetical protein
VSQYTTQLLIPDVERCIDDIQYANYNIPTLQYGQRVLKQRDRHVQLGAVYEYTEEDYVDAREPRTYHTPDVEFAPALTAEQHTRLDVINALLQSMVNGRGCTDKQLKRVLTAEQHHDYINAATTQQHPSESDYGDGIPDVLREYKSMVQRADFKYNTMDRLSQLRSSGRGKCTAETVAKMSNQTDGLYERALERLGEIVDTATWPEKRQINIWMDRELDFDAGNNRTIGIDPVSIPRVRGSKSTNALDTGLPKLSKRLKRKECQLMALRDAAWNLAFVVDGQQYRQSLEQPSALVMQLQLHRKALPSSSSETGKSKLQQILDGEDDDY